MKCPFCGSDLPDEAAFCLNCFRRVNNPKAITVTEKSKRSNNTFILALVIIVIIAIITAVAVKCISQKDDSEESETVQSYTSQHTDTKAEAVTTQTEVTKTTAETITTVTETSSTTTTEITTKESTTKKPTSTTKNETTEKKKTTTESTKKVSAVIKDGVLVSYPADKSDKTYTIPYNVKRIANGAFDNNKYLQTIKFSKRENVECNFSNLVNNLPNLKNVYIYPGTTADIDGIVYFSGKRIVYYD